MAGRGRKKCAIAFETRQGNGPQLQGPQLRDTAGPRVPRAAARAFRRSQGRVGPDGKLRARADEIRTGGQLAVNGYRSMAPRGRKNKPTMLKVVGGTDRKDPGNDDEIQPPLALPIQSPHLSD